MKRRYFAQLEGYLVMPEDELFSFQKVILTTSAKQIISHQNAKAICSRCGEEIINEREVVIDNKVLCKTCTGVGYYHKK
jgi:formylmethanofuran dehydrogenase subunit E